MASLIQKLREETGAGVMECKRALDEAAGDYNLAKALVEKQGLLTAAKKAERATGAGLLEAYVHNGRVGVLLELRSETDFVAPSEPGKDFAHNLTLHVAGLGSAGVVSVIQNTFV